MKINEILLENDLAAQIDASSRLMTQHMRQRWEAEQRANQTAPAPAPAAVASTAIQVTPDMIAKHPQYKAWYDKYYKAEFAKDGNPASATIQAKKYADSKITRLIQQGQ